MITNDRVLELARKRLNTAPGVLFVATDEELLALVHDVLAELEGSKVGAKVEQLLTGGSPQDPNTAVIAL